tara:strand:- start:628 stop:840 length:213 start_codon:yes stop_codon:yes gene_type:complete
MAILFSEFPPRENDQEVIYVRQKDTPFPPKSTSILKRKNTTPSKENTTKFLEKMGSETPQEKTNRKVSPA